jgi:hypothetical protein
MGTSDVLTAEELAEIVVKYWGWSISDSKGGFEKRHDIFIEVIRGVSDELRDEAYALAAEMDDGRKEY